MTKESEGGGDVIFIGRKKKQAGGRHSVDILCPRIDMTAIKNGLLSLFLNNFIGLTSVRCNNAKLDAVL